MKERVFQFLWMISGNSKKQKIHGFYCAGILHFYFYFMQIIFSPKALEDLRYWKATGNSQILKRIRNLLESISETPFEGIGKPEALKYNWSGFWSRRITKEHRIIYTVHNNTIMVAQIRNHYE